MLGRVLEQAARSPELGCVPQAPQLARSAQGCAQRGLQRPRIQPVQTEEQMAQAAELQTKDGPE